MINLVRIVNHRGEELELELRSPEKSGFFIKNIDGLGPSRSYINISESINMHGGTFNSSRSTYRNLVFDLGFYNDGSDSIETIRQRSYQYFPLNKEILIEVESDNRKGYTTGYVETNEPNIFSREENTVISILCPSAFFYGIDTIHTYFTSVTGGFQFPFSNESTTLKLLQFGTLSMDTQKSIFYTGDSPTGVTIYIDFLGNVNDPRVYNLTENQTMWFRSDRVISMTGSDFKLGDKLIVTTTVGKKSITLIRSGSSYNLLNCLSSDSTWITLGHGDNLITYSADSGATSMQLGIDHEIVYEGI